MVMDRVYVPIIISLLSIPVLLASCGLAYICYMNAGGDDSTGALLTCGDGTHYVVSEPYHNGDSVYPQNHVIRYRETLDAVSPSLVRDGSDPKNIYGFRCLRGELIGVSERGYFVYDNKSKSYFLTSDHKRWLMMLQRLGINDNTLLYPGPVRDSYAKRGLLEYHSSERTWW